MTTPNGGIIPVQGRTALNFVFGNPDDPPQPVPKVDAPPDLVIAHDAWAYRLAPYAADASGLWKLQAPEPAGLQDSLQRHGQIYAHGLGATSLAAAAEAPAWTWDEVLAQVPPGSRPSTLGFSAGGAQRGAIEASAAPVAAYGGSPAHPPMPLVLATGDSAVLAQAFGAFDRQVAPVVPGPVTDRLRSLSHRPNWRLEPARPDQPLAPGFAALDAVLRRATRRLLHIIAGSA